MTRGAERITLVVRHAEASAQALDAPLSARGRIQAEGLARKLAPLPIDAVYTSPYLRAIETVTPFATRADLSVRRDPRLRERSLASAPQEDWREVIRASFSEPDLRRPGGETAREALSRFTDLLGDLACEADRLPLLVSHGHLLSLVLHAVDSKVGYDDWNSLTNPDVYEIVFVDDRPIRSRRREDLLEIAGQEPGSVALSDP